MMSAPRQEEEIRPNLVDEAASAPRHNLEQVRSAFGLEVCMVVDENRRMLSSASETTTPFLQTLAEVTPTMALLPECRSLHLNHLRKSRPDLEDDEVTSCSFQAGGRRFFVCAVGRDARACQAEILNAVLSGC